MTAPQRRHSDRMPVDLYVSPHLDDVVLSAGGRLAASAREGRMAIVATVFAGPIPCDPEAELAREYHEIMGIGSDPLVRKREDHEALRLLGALPVHLGHLDCIYRVRPDGSPEISCEQDIFLAGGTAALVEHICEDLRELIIRLSVDRVFLPAAVGRHRDHVVTREAAERAARCTRTYADISYFEDVPYILQSLDDLPSATQGMSPSTFPLTAEELEARLTAIECYGSQQRILWDDGRRLSEVIREYAGRVGNGMPAEQYWQPVTERSDS